MVFLFSAAFNHLCNFGRGHYEEHFWSGTYHLCSFGKENFGRRQHEEQFCKSILNLDQWFKRCFKDISYLELWWPFHSAKQKHLCNLGGGHHEEHFCEIILNWTSGSRDVF